MDEKDIMPTIEMFTKRGIEKLEEFLFQTYDECFTSTFNDEKREKLLNYFLN